MMFVGEKYLVTCLDDLQDIQIQRIIEKSLGKFEKIKSKRDNYEVLGIKVTNNYWQKLAFFAVMYKTSVAKVASCIFDFSLSAYEVRIIMEEHGLKFAYDKKERFKGRTYNNGRLSDY